MSRRRFIIDLKKLFGYEGKTVVITGSASGMSKAATELLLELGANVYAIDINKFTCNKGFSSGYEPKRRNR